MAFLGRKNDFDIGLDAPIPRIGHATPILRSMKDGPVGKAIMGDGEADGGLVAGQLDEMLDAALAEAASPTPSPRPRA